MASTVEAASLSLITDIAEHPPLTPDLTTTLPLQPLVFYIVRVPGSPDVFLTPMKPRAKVVSAEDVQSSFYYVHFHHEDDILFYESSSTKQDVPDSTTTLPSETKRKPLSSRIDPPQRPNPSTDFSWQSDAGIAVVNDFKSGVPRRPLPPIPDDRLPSAATHKPRASDGKLQGGLEDSTVTLIRRDPATGRQWNIATIHDPPVQEVSSMRLGSESRTKKSGAPLYLDIVNPAYQQFVDQDCAATDNDSSMAESASPKHVFRRRLYMPGSRLADQQFGHRRLQSDILGVKSRSRWHTRSDSTGNASLSYIRPKGYSFTSPWEGTCEFKTSATGNALKCRHSYGQVSVQISELRFNLPSASHPDSSTSPNSTRRARKYSREDSGKTPTIVVDDHGRVDVSLGQEKAGGGFGGKQAKLGKLIIEPAGFSMLDLLVAANLGLWWRAYEKTGRLA
ncbi:hypothetical protein K470DRAFT_298828 [Piedraia hortae CBS 480.64]|uniref:Oxidoreductase-like protein n=1 Tax=Piedraia hortae CBS 480.64 TaxID=1314780 RepID=A0A6A7C5P0_9PEZI|nr:hypothetical protein K470DRAFT_298828 [Piedraia hortae CBS 480.64]